MDIEVNKFSISNETSSHQQCQELSSESLNGSRGRCRLFSIHSHIVPPHFNFRIKLGWFNDAVATVTQNNIVSVSLKGQVYYQPGVSNQDPVIIQIDVADSTENCKFNYFSNRVGRWRIVISLNAFGLH